MARTAKIERKTTETDIVLSLDLDGTGQSQIKSGVGFFDHMLELLARHSALDLTRCYVETIALAWYSGG